MILLISYDLNVPGKDYASLYEVLKSADGWWHFLDSTWILRTDKSVNWWTDRVRKVIDENDNFFIVDITGAEHNGWLPKKAWGWIDRHNS